MYNTFCHTPYFALQKKCYNPFWSNVNENFNSKSVTNSCYLFSLSIQKISKKNFKNENIACTF